jgi:hypothetical protein
MGRILLLVFLALFLILASLRRWKLFFGLTAAALAAALALLFITVRPPETATPGPGLARVRLAYSPDKRALVTATAFGEALKADHGLIVGGIRLAADPSPEAFPECDALWIDGYRGLDRLAASGRVPRKTLEIFGAQLVVATWPEIAAALERRGLVQMDGAGGTLLDPAALLALAAEDASWTALGLRDRSGPVRLLAPAPDGDATGRKAALWIAGVLAGEIPPSAETVETHLPALRELYGRMAPLESSAMDLFDRFVKQGAWTFPMVLVDEQVVVAFDRAFPAYRETIRDRVRLLRLPGSPAVVHPVAGFSPIGDRFLAALDSPEMRGLIWERHGLRPLAGPPSPPPDLVAHFALGAWAAPERPDPRVLERLARIARTP